MTGTHTDSERGHTLSTGTRGDSEPGRVPFPLTRGGPYPIQTYAGGPYQIRAHGVSLRGELAYQSPFMGTANRGRLEMARAL